MSAEAFQWIAREADRLAAELEALARNLTLLGERTLDVIGGTATGADRKMLGLANQAASETRAAARSFAEAGNLARRAAAESSRDTAKTKPTSRQR